jgi:hypothetical protein
MSFGNTIFSVQEKALFELQEKTFDIYFQHDGKITVEQAQQEALRVMNAEREKENKK